MTPEQTPPVGPVQVYANGFQMGLTNADVTILLQFNGKPFQSLNISPIIAKTMAVGLLECVEKFEKATGQKIPVTGEVDEAFKKAGFLASPALRA